MELGQRWWLVTRNTTLSVVDGCATSVELTGAETALTRARLDLGAWERRLEVGMGVVLGEACEACVVLRLGVRWLGFVLFGCCACSSRGVQSALDVAGPRVIEAVEVAVVAPRCAAPGIGERLGAWTDALLAEVWISEPYQWTPGWMDRGKRDTDGASSVLTLLPDGGLWLLDAWIDGRGERWQVLGDRGFRLWHGCWQLGASARAGDVSLRVEREEGFHPQGPSYAGELIGPLQLVSGRELDFLRTRFAPAPESHAVAARRLIEQVRVSDAEAFALQRAPVVGTSRELLQRLARGLALGLEQVKRGRSAVEPSARRREFEIALGEPSRMTVEPVQGLSAEQAQLHERLSRWLGSDGVELAADEVERGRFVGLELLLGLLEDAIAPASRIWLLQADGRLLVRTERRLKSGRCEDALWEVDRELEGARVVRPESLRKVGASCCAREACPAAEPAAALYAWLAAEVPGDGRFIPREGVLVTAADRFFGPAGEHVCEPSGGARGRDAVRVHASMAPERRAKLLPRFSLTAFGAAECDGEWDAQGAGHCLLRIPMDEVCVVLRKGDGGASFVERLERYDWGH